jgi:pimeloyl-ACP methyl ester carboxylesterase
MALMQVIVDNLSVVYERSGKGRAVLLFHGWGDDHRTFQSLVPLLTDRYELIALDLPGFGASQAPQAAWNLDDYARLVADFLIKVKIDRLYAIIGHSNGGALAIRGLSLGLFKADKLVLIASAGVRNSQPAKRALTKTVAKAGKATTFWLPKETKDRLRTKLYGTVGSDMLAVPTLEQTFKLTVRQDVQADAAKLRLPTLLISAANDPAIPLKDGRRFSHLITGSRLEVLESDSHFIHHAQSQKVAKLILEFL